MEQNPARKKKRAAMIVGKILVMRKAVEDVERGGLCRIYFTFNHVEVKNLTRPWPKYLSRAQVFTTEGSLLLTMPEKFMGSGIGPDGAKAFATALKDPDQDGKATSSNVCVWCV